MKSVGRPISKMVATWRVVEPIKQRVALLAQTHPAAALQLKVLPQQQAELAEEAHG
jgi:hypothetical protein